jgi:diguanylate cyclase (GGDEF)-like protein/PAS domain S-box-containing protein
MHTGNQHHSSSTDEEPAAVGASQHSRLDWHHILWGTAVRIHQSLDLSTVLQTAVDAVQALLQCDRVIIYRFSPDWSGEVSVESLSDPGWSILHRVVHDPCFEANWLGSYHQHRYTAIENIETADISACHAEFLADFQVTANLVMPLHCQEHLWGLLIAHECHTSRCWQDDEIQGLQQLAIHIGIAIHQATLLDELQTAKEQIEVEYQHTQTQLGHSQDELLRLATIVDSTHDTIISQTVDGTITSFNPAAEALLDYAAEDVIGQSMFQFIPPELRPQDQTILECIRSGHSVRNHETRRCRRDGQLIEVEMTVSPIRDRDGRVIGSSSIIRDVGDRRRIERSLAENRKQLADFFENASDVIQSVSLEDGRFLYVNRTWLNILGYPSPEDKHLKIFDIIVPDDLPYYQRIFDQLKNGEVSAVDNVNITVVAHDGRRIMLEGNINVRSDQGMPVATRAIFRDVTEQRQAELILQQQAATLRIFYDTCPLLMGTVEITEHDILHTSDNPAALRWFDLDPATPELRWASESGVPPETIEQWLMYYRQSQAALESVQFEYDHITNTQTYSLLATVTFIGIASSDRPAFSFIVQDISDRRRIEKEQQRALKTHQELTLLEKILDVVLAGYWDWDIPNHQEYLSTGFKQMFGYADHELPNTPEAWQNIIFPDDLPGVYEQFDRHIQSKGTEPFYNEVRYRHKNGSTVWVLCSGAVIEWNEDGTPKRMVGCHIDITRLKDTEDTLRKSEMTNRALIDALPDFLVQMRQDGLQLSVINEGAIHCMYPPQPLDGINGHWITDIMPRAIADQRIHLAQQAIATGLVQQQEYQFQTGGTIFYEEARIVPLWEDEVLIIVRDITQQKHAEQELQSVKHQLELFIQATSEGFWDWDLVTNKIYFSPRWKEMLGYADHELENSLQTWESIIFEPDRITALEKISAYNSGQTDHFTETQRFRHKDGSTVYILSRAIHVKDERGQAVRMIGSHLDITPMIQIQDDLSTSKMQLSGVLNSSLDGVMAFKSIRDEHGQIIDFEWLLSNSKGCEVVGYRAEQLMGHRLLERLPGNREEGLFDLYVHVVETGEVAKRQFYYDHDGISQWFENVTVKLGDGFVVTFRDITNIKQSEQQLREANLTLAAHVHDLEQRNTEMILLSETSDFLQACRTIEEACAVITTLVEPLFPECAGAIFLTSASRNRVEQMATWGEHLSSKIDFPPHDCWGLRRGRLHAINQQRGQLRCNHIHATAEIAETYCIPMIAQGETLGLFYLNTQQDQSLPEAKQQLAKTVAEQIALAIANLRLREILQHQSIRDPLTGLFNRRYLEESLQAELARAQRKQYTVCVLMLDVDHFKQFNDSYGHEVGDYVLQAVGQLLRDNVRNSDIACRYGGEELTLIFSETEANMGFQRAEEIRNAISQLRVTHNGQTTKPVTVSIGMACFPTHGANAADLLQVADASLYRAKQNGRNQTVVSP